MISLLDSYKGRYYGKRQGLLRGLVAWRYSHSDGCALRSQVHSREPFTPVSKLMQIFKALFVTFKVVIARRCPAHGYNGSGGFARPCNGCQASSQYHTPQGIWRHQISNFFFNLDRFQITGLIAIFEIDYVVSSSITILRWWPWILRSSLLATSHLFACTTTKESITTEKKQWPSDGEI
jgi:hypothetical protein